MTSTGLGRHFHYNDAPIGYKHLRQHRDRGDLTADDEDLITRYLVERRAARNISIGRVNKIIFQLMVWRKFGPAFRGTTIEDLYKGIDALLESEYKQNSKYDTVSIIKPFFLWLIEEGICTKIPEKKLSAIRRPPLDTMTKTVEDLLSYDDLQKIMDSCRRSRDRALVMTLYEGGLRIGEAGGLEWGDVKFDDWGAIINVNKKTMKPRYVRLILAREHLANWKRDYTRKPIEAGSRVFITSLRNDPRYESLFKQLRRIVKRAGITKRVSPHTFRHSRITHLIQEGVQESVIKMMMWGSLTTDQLKTYAHLTNADIDRGILEAAGITRPIRHKSKALKPQQCSTCGQVLGPSVQFCPTCGTDLSEAGRMSSEQAKRWLLQNRETLIRLLGDADRQGPA